MVDWSKANLSWAGRFCVRLAIVLCLVVSAFGSAVEHGLEADSGRSSSTLALEVVPESSRDEVSGDIDKGAELADHGCHGCAAIPQPLRNGAAGHRAFNKAIPAWASVPSSSGREPLIDLRPPRA
ncbi:hypothetical protein [Hansschlegelia plantiphila]|uniref:DUF2946 domain-containing protein n=1 Tax=Hansschlegelia plantiphila TaxID=374655 RepID=A0A9W6MWX0_9HYPH|nr:hypothetical protein [Hansschlegelia plantiphila]GLK69267.1 hypothetical protein GCM10008179_29050 [Hansschlegelia plantiphila]